jgi:hypothetical protein
MLSRRLVAVAAGVLIAVGAAVWFIGCSVNVNPGGGGNNPSVSLTIANKTITLQLGAAGVFQFTGGASVTNVADVVPFEKPPDDMPVSAVIRIRPEDVTVNLELPDAKSVSTPQTAKTITGSFVLLAYISQRGDPNPCATGTEVGIWALNVVNNVVTNVGFGTELHNHELQLFLDNGFTLCLTTNIDTTSNNLDPTKLRGTVTFQGLQISFGPHGEVAFVDVSTQPPPGTTEACCWPPLSVYYQFHEPRQQLCEDLSFNERFGTPKQQCERAGGIWKGAGSSCATATCGEDFRVCCLQGRDISQPCEEYSESYCVNSPVNEATYTVFPPGVTCETDPPPCNEETAACCYSDGPCRTIPIRILGQCPDGGISQGVGTDCQTTTCPAAPPAPSKQACCFESGLCDDLPTEDCGVAGGTPKGPGTNCSPNLCPQPAPKAACCASDGTCTVATQAACTAPGSTFNSGSSTCSPNPCPQPQAPTGACCVTGNCNDLTATECAALPGGVYSGDGTACATVQCAPAKEYLVWYTGNVSCWSAPLIYIDDRDTFNQPGYAANYPGGGIDYSVPLVKTELQGGFASVEEARAWICPQFVSRFSHYWCSSYYQTANCNWQPGALGCDLSAIPFTDALPAGTSCP